MNQACRKPPKLSVWFICGALFEEDANEPDTDNLGGFLLNKMSNNHPSGFNRLCLTPHQKSLCATNFICNSPRLPHWGSIILVKRFQFNIILCRCKKRAVIWFSSILSLCIMIAFAIWFSTVSDLEHLFGAWKISVCARIRVGTRIPGPGVSITLPTRGTSNSCLLWLTAIPNILSSLESNSDNLKGYVYAIKRTHIHWVTCEFVV